MSASSATQAVDASLLAAFRRGRLPTLLGSFALVVTVGVVTGWPLGLLPALLAGLGVVHAVWERGHAETNPAYGLSIDIVVGMYIVWLPGVPEFLIGCGMMFGVLVAYFHAGVARIVLLAILAVSLSATLIATPPEGWMPDSLRAFLARTVPFVFIGLVVLVLSFAAQALRRSEIERGYVVGTVAHELRNDLTPIAGLAMVLVDEAHELGRPDLAEMAGIVAAQAMDAAETVEDLMTLARLDRDSLDLSITPVRITSEVEGVLARVGLVDVSVTGSTGVEWALGDPMRIRQVIRNLCTNAQRYGGDAVQIEIKTDAADACHVLVRDNGEGISEDEVATVFEPFGRGAAGRQNSGSVGLGLWISRQLARAMDGDLTYRREGGWTVFSLRLPRAEAPPAPV